MHLRVLSIVGLIFSSAAMSAHSFAQDAVRFAGIGFVQSTRVANENLIHAGRFGTRSELSSPFFDRVSEEITNVVLGDGQSIVLGLASLASNESTSLALTFESEEVVINRLSEKEYTLKYTLDAPVVVFDVIKQTVLTSYPVRLAATNSYEYEPTPQDIEKFTNSLYLGSSGDARDSLVINSFLDALKILEIQQSYGFNIQVKDITLSENAELYFQKHNIDKDFYRQKIASAFGSILNTELSVPVLPYIKGDAIARRISLNFEETGLIDLEIPEATFSIDLGLRGFGTKLIQESGLVQRYAFVVGLTVEVVDEGFATSVTSRSYQLGIPKNFTKAMLVNEVYWHNEAMLALMSGVVKQFSSYDRKWAREHVAGEYSDRDLRKEFENVMSDVFEQLN